MDAQSDSSLCERRSHFNPELLLVDGEHVAKAVRDVAELAISALPPKRLRLFLRVLAAAFDACQPVEPEVHHEGR